MQHLQKRRLSPTGRLNLGLIIEGKLAAVLIIPSSWGLPTTLHKSSSTQRPARLFWRRCYIQVSWASSIFWRHCRGERSLLQGESLALNLFILFLFCLFYFALFCLLRFIKNPKKLVTIITAFVCLLYQKSKKKKISFHYIAFIFVDLFCCFDG